MNTSISKNHCLVASIGTVDYREAWDLQNTLHTQVMHSIIPNVLLLLEHPHVYTLGRRASHSDILASPNELAKLDITVHEADRGGEVTYHGPGQLIAYPIVDMRAWGGGPLKYLRALEQVVIGTLEEFGIKANSVNRPTGVWVSESKIAAIGVKVSRGVTTHGLALNVCPDLSYFDHIVPFGIPNASVTSMMAQDSNVQNVGTVAHTMARRFGNVFGWSLSWTNLIDLNRKTQIPVSSYI